jgi:hypothetical protein
MRRYSEGSLREARAALELDEMRRQGPLAFAASPSPSPSKSVDGGMNDTAIDGGNMSINAAAEAGPFNPSLSELSFKLFCS